MKQVYVAGYNLPGYMPDADPCVFETQDEAKHYILSALKWAEETAETEREAETICAFAEDVSLQRGEFSAQCGAWVYWVTSDHVEDEGGAA